MINQNKINEYIKAIEIGINYYGLSGLLEMHKDVCKNTESPWGYDLESLNDLNITEFHLLYNVSHSPSSTSGK